MVVRRPFRLPHRLFVGIIDGKRLFEGSILTRFHSGDHLRIVTPVLAQSFYGDRFNFTTMGYLLIKKNDVKTFKSFLNGKEIEVGVHIGSNADIFNPDEEIDIFYDSDTYRARITRQTKSRGASANHALVTLGLVKQ